MISRARHRLRRSRDALAQVRYPPEFRVPPPQLDPAQAEWVASLLAETGTGETGKAAETAETAETAESAESLTVGDRPSDGAGSAALVGAAVGIWRALRKLGQEAPALSAADLRQIRRQINSSRQALSDDGLEIQDHDGQAFDSGLSLEVLLFQEEPGLSRETVLETVRPSVYFRGERIQMGQVIVGRPAPGPEPGSEPEPGTATDSVPPRQVDDQGEHHHA